QPYRWHGGTPWEIAHDELPYIDEATAHALVADIIALLAGEHGYAPAGERPKATGNGQSAGAADWSYLYDNIVKGVDLHRSLTILAAKLVTTGMDGGAAVNQLRGLMETS